MRRCIVALQLVLVMLLNVAAVPLAGAEAEPTLRSAPANASPEQDESPADPVDEREAEAEESGDDAEEGMLHSVTSAPPSLGRFHAPGEERDYPDSHRPPLDRPPRSL